MQHHVPSFERFSLSNFFSVERQISSKQELLKEASGLRSENRRFLINLKLSVCFINFWNREKHFDNLFH
jgi:hypothetical protein